MITLVILEKQSDENPVKHAVDIASSLVGRMLGTGAGSQYTKLFQDSIYYFADIAAIFGS